MIKIYEGGLKAEDIFDRTEEKNTVGEIVADIIADVRKNGDDALKAYSEKFFLCGNGERIILIINREKWPFFKVSNQIFLKNHHIF